ncbi:transcription factor GLABRA 3-like isoform X1 [Hibiscus syriacus]|uniref:Transcription factor GLABRA 3-like isoform X1 n=1 Tax=Hibiscus syriacus TaxID=106335 RepID=A0A6A3C2I6_HIBSY|nr:gibberellin 20-oxidase-like protein [Hibiscus syriacus]KAE8722231.1 transcription factor GLABRA 3-like isoform X1 [Hibiscus syriacus]
MSELEDSLKLPVLDLNATSLYSSSSSSLLKACEEWGFFYVTNHGIPQNLFTKIREFSDDVFCLCSDTKLKLGPSSCLKTYTPRFIASSYFESLRVSGPDFFASSQASIDELFGQGRPEFSEILQEYGSNMTKLSKRIIEIILKSLGDGYEKKFSDSEFGNCHGYMRISNYKPPDDVEEKEVEGLGMHTDMSCITIVFQDELGGLQMRSKDGKWLNIHPCEDSLVVNIGDLMQAWSNGRLRSSEHRVVLRRFRNRFSLAFFWCFEDQKVIVAPDEIVGTGNPRIYSPFVCLKYMKFRESNEVGNFEKIGYTVKDFAGLKVGDAVI